MLMFNCALERGLGDGFLRGLAAQIRHRHAHCLELAVKRFRRSEIS